MMTREHHRRRSPESTRRRRKERRDSREQLQTRPPPVSVTRYEERAEPIDLQSRAFSPYSSSSSTSSSLVNISRPSRFGLGNFFGGGRKQHRVRKKRSRFLRFGNSSSSSVNSDLAYGKGYIERRRSREFSPPTSAGRPALSRRAQTDEEIIELGRQFAEIARQQNAEDLRAAGRTRPSGLVSAASALSQFRRTNSGPSNRGVGSSKPRRDSSPDDSEWESASDDDSSSSEFDSGLAYGSGLSLPNTAEKVVRAVDPPRPSRSPRSPRSPRLLRSPPSLQAPNHDSPLHRKPSVVDPNLFGPVNSLRGYVETPCGFEKVDRSKLDSPRRPYEPSIPPSEAISETRPLQRVYPIPTSDPGRFDARGSVVSSQQGVSTPPRPAPVPIQHPKPIAPVSRKVLDTVETDSRFSDRSLSRKSIGETAIAGVAGAALGAALSSDRRDERERHEGKRDRDSKRRSKRSDTGALDERAEKRRSRDVPRDEPRDEPREEPREDRFERRREKRSEQDRDSEKDRRLREMIAAEAERESEKEKRRRDKYRDEGNDYDRERRERHEGRNDRRIDDRKNERKTDRNETRREERASRSEMESHKRLEGSGYPPQEGPIDPFQFQVKDDAFQTPLHTTPRRPLTPNVITVDREPDFSRFEPTEDDVRPLERLSRKDSYERDLRNAHEIYEVAEHATAPVTEAAFAVATAAVMAEDRRGRSRSRSTDATSRIRSGRGESPKRERDAVLENANRYYREAELARRIQEEDRRFHGTTESSVIDKWKQAKQPVTIDIIAPPEMGHPKKKSPYDGPDADVRIDNVLEHPSELSRFRAPATKGLAAAPVFKARDPSAERERPMLNVVRPTPVPTPTLELQRRLEELSHEPTTEIDTSVSNNVSDVVIGPRGEVIPAPPTPKAVSWGENQTKHYVVESPEREDDPYSGTKIVTPAKPPRSRAGRKTGWGIIAAAVGGTSDGAAASSTTDPTIDSEVTRTGRSSKDGEKTTSRKSSVQLEGMYDSPPVPGPKPPSPRSVQMPGAFAEDPAFTANIAAALQGSGFDPNIVIDNASFHRRDSPPGSNDSDVYHSPFVESVIDLGSTASQNGREHGYVIGEVPETPSDEQDITTNKSEILARLKELRKQQSAAGHGGPSGPEIITDNKPVESRSIAEDEWDAPSSKLSKKERNRREKSTEARPAEVDVPVDDASRVEQDLEAEFGVAAADEGQDTSLKRKKSKKSKKVIVVQDSSKQPDTESPKVTIPANASPDVQGAETTQQDAEWDPPKESRRRPQRDSEAHEFARSAPASELSMESSYRVIDADSVPATDDEWDTPKTSRRGSGAYSFLSRSAQASEISLELARRTTLPASLHDDEHDISSKKKSKRNTIDDEFSSSFARSTDDLSRSQDSRTNSRRSSRAYDSPSHEDPLTEDIVESPIEMTESISDLRSEKTAATEEEWDMTPKKSKKKSKRGSATYEDTPSTPVSQTAPSEASVTSSRRSKHDSYTDSPSRSAPGSEIGADDSRKKGKKKKKRRSTSDGILDDGNANGSEPPDGGKDRFEALDRDVSSVVSDPSRYDDHKSSRSRRSEVLDDTKSVASAPSSVDRRDRKSSKSEKEARNSGSSGFFDRLKSSIGIAEEKEKGRLRKSEEDKKNSFLDNAGTLGAGVGSTGAAIAPVSQESRSNATNDTLEEETQIVPTTPERQSTRPQEVEFIDPEIVPREIRPAIDPKYGDLLPLPPSLPGSPVPELGDNYPPLPDSRPESPEHERHLHEMPTHVRRRSGIETPHRPKTPSQGAIPLQFLLGHKATPESPSALRSPSVRSPSASPVTGISEFSERRRRPRPTSWESSREFKPLLLLQRAFRESSNMMSSPERESSPSGRLHELSPSRIEDCEDTSQSSSHIPAESLGLDPQSHERVPDTPVQSAATEFVEAPAIPHVTETISHSTNDGASDQPSDEILHRQATGVDDTSLLSPPLESSDLPLPDNEQVNVEHEVDFQEDLEQQPSEFVENGELRSPKPELKLIVPDSDAHSLSHTIQEPDDANILPISPTLASDQKSKELDEPPKDSLEDNFKDVAHVAETATPVPGDVQVMTVLDDRGPGQATEAVGAFAMQNKDVPTSGIISEGKELTPPDALDTSESNIMDNGLVELSSYLEKLHEDENAQREKKTEVGELPKVSIDVESPPVQDEVVPSDAVIEQVPVNEPTQEPTVQEPVVVETSTKETPEFSERALEEALNNDEAPSSEAPALETRDEPLPGEVPREIIDVPQPEAATSNVQQNTSTSSKKGKKKKKNRKSQATVPSLDDQPVITETRDASLDELPSQPTEEVTITPAEFTPTPVEGESSTIEEKPLAIEKEFRVEETPITSEPEASTVELSPVGKEFTAEEKPVATEELADIEREFTVGEKPTTSGQEASVKSAPIEKEFTGEEEPLAADEPATIEKEFIAEKTTTSESQLPTIEPATAQKGFGVEEEPLATEQPATIEELTSEKATPSQPKTPTVEPTAVEKEFDVQEKPTTSKAEVSTVEPTVDEPSSSAWNFWGATKKSAKKAKETSQTTTADGSGSWLDWGKLLKGTTGTPVETKKETEPAIVESETAATEKEVPTIEAETPVTQLETSAVEPDVPSIEPERITVGLDDSTLQHEPSTLQLETDPTEPKLEPEPESGSTIVEPATSITEAEPIPVQPETTTEPDATVVQAEPTTAEVEPTVIKPEIASAEPQSNTVNLATSSIEAELTPVDPNESEFKDTPGTEPETIAEPEVTAEPEVIATETEPIASKLEATPAELELQPELLAEQQIEPTTLSPGTSATDAEPATVEPETKETLTTESKSIAFEAEPTIAELESAPIGPGMAVEPEVEVEPDQTVLEEESAATEKGIPSAEIEAPLGKEPAVAEVVSTVDEAELMPVKQEPATATEDPVAEEVKPEQPVSTVEASTSVSKKGKKKKKKGKQQSPLEEELAEPTTQEESAKAAELTLEDNSQTPDTLPAELQSSAQDLREATIQEPPDVQLNLPEESPSSTKKSKKKKKGKKMQNLELEPEPETAIEQSTTQEQENRPLPEDAKPVPAVQEVEAAIQADDQVADNAPKQLVEIPAGHQETKLELDTRPGDKPISEEVPSDEPPKLDETSRDNEETSREISSPSGLFEPLSSNPEADSPRELQSALLSDAGHDQQRDTILGPVLGEGQLRSDTNKPENSVVASVVQDDLNIGQEHEAESTLTGALQGPVEQEPSGSKSLEHIDESPLQPNLPGGEDPREQDLASTDPPEAPLYGAIPTENMQDGSIEQQTEAVEEPALNVVVDDAHSSSLPNEPIAEEPQEMALSREDVGSKKKKGKKNKKQRQDASEVVESPIVTETPEKPTPQITEPEANLDEPLVASDVPEQTTQESTELPGDGSLQEPTGTTEVSKGEQGQDTKVVDITEEPEALKSEEPSIEPQTDADIVQKPVADQIEPTGDDAGPEAESSSKKSKKKKGKKNRQSIDQSVLSIEPEPSKSVEEPVTGEAVIDNNQSTEVMNVSPEIDVAADGQLEKDPAPEIEVEAVPSKKKSKKDKKKRSSAQLEPAIGEETPEESSENLVAQDDANSEATPQTEPTLDVDVDATTGDKQVTPAQEVEELKPTSKKTKKGKKKPSQSRNDAEEILTSISAPETLAEPSTTSEELAQAPKEDSDTGLISTTETPKEDKRQSVRFAEPLGQDPMEIPAETPIDPTIEFPETDTTSDWASADIPPLPDFWSKSESHDDDVPSSFDDSLKTQYEPFQNQSVDPLDQLPETIETEKQAEAPGNEGDKFASQDVNIATISEEPSFEKSAEVLEGAHADETKDQLLAETTPKDESDIAQQSSAEVVPAEQQSTEDQKSVEADIVEERTTHDESQIALVPTDQDNIPTEVDTLEVSHPQVEIEQLGEDKAKANDETTTPQVEESTLVAPAISEDAGSRDPVEPPKPTEPLAEPIPSTEDSTVVTAEDESPILAKKSKKDKKKKRKSKTQDALDSTSGTATPAEEPSIESPSSQQIDTALATSQGQAEPSQVVPDIPITTEPEQLVAESELQEDEPQTSAIKKGKKDKKKKNKASQIQEPEPSSLPAEETPVERPQSPVHDSSQMQTADSSGLPLPQEIELQQPLAQEGLSDQPALPVPETSETAGDASEIPISATQDPTSEPADVPLQREDTQQERATEIEKTSDDVPAVEAEPVATSTVATSSGDPATVSESHKQEEVPQTSDVTLTPEQEPIVEQPVLDEEPQGVVAAPKSKKDKKKKKKKRDSQDISASASGIATPVEETKSLADTAAPIASEDVSISVKDNEPTVEPSEPIENTAPVVSQDISEYLPDVQPAPEARDFAETSSTPAEPFPDLPTTTIPVTELDLQGSERVSAEESKEGQDIQEAALPDDDTSQQTPREQTEEILVTPTPPEQTEIDDSIAAETSKGEDTAELAPAKKSKKGKKKKKSNTLNDAQPQEPTEVLQDSIVDTKQVETSSPIPQEISKDEGAAELELPKSGAGQEEKSAVDDLQLQDESTEIPPETAGDTIQAEVSIPTHQGTSNDEDTHVLESAKNKDQEEKSSTSDDVQSQEEQSKVVAEPTVALSEGEPLKTEVQAPESSKDENTDETVPAKKSKKGKKKKRAGLEDSPAEQQDSVQTVDELVTDTPTAEQIETEQPAVAESSKDGDTQDVTSGKKSKKDKKKKKRASTLEAEPEPKPPVEPEPSTELEPPTEPEPSTISQPVELSTETSRSDAPPMNLEDVILAEEALPAGPSEMPHVPTSDNELPVASTQENTSLEEGPVTEQPVKVIKEQIAEHPLEDTTTTSLISDIATVDVAQPDVTNATQLEVNSQVPDGQTTDTTLAVPPREHESLPLTEEPTQQGEKPDVESKAALPEEQAELVQSKESPISEEPTHTEEHSKLENPTEQGEFVQAQEPSKPEDPVQVDESSNLEKSSKPEELVKVEEPIPAEEPTPAQEPVHVEEPVQPEETLQPAEPTQTERSLGTEELAQQEAPLQAEEPSKPDESTQLEESHKPKEIPQLEDAPKLEDSLAQLEEHVQISDSASQEPSKTEPMQPDLSLKPEEPVQLEESAPQELLKAEEPEQSEERALVEEPVQLEEPTQLAEQPSLILDEPELAPGKKSKKDKKKKKKASQAESDPVTESVQQIEESQAQASLPEQSPNQDNSKAPPEVAESTPAVEDPTMIAKDSAGVEDAVPEVATGKKSKKKKKRASQIVAEPAQESSLPADGPAEQSTLPEHLSSFEQAQEQQVQEPQLAPERVLPTDEPAEQSSLLEPSLPEQHQEQQPEELQPTPKNELTADEPMVHSPLPEQPSLPEQRSLSEQSPPPEQPSLSEQLQEQLPQEPQPILERTRLVDEPAEQPSLPEQPQEPQDHDNQPIAEANPVAVTDVTNTEDVFPETSTSKKSKKKKKRASQVDQNLQESTSTPLEPQSQPLLLEEPLVQEPVEQPDSQTTVEEPVATKEEEDPEVIPEAVSSKKSKKEKRKAKKLATSTTEPEPKDDLKLEEQPTASEVEPSYPEQVVEPVDPVLETTAPLATEATSTNLQVEHLESPTEVELSLQPDEDQSADIAEKHEGEISEPTAREENKPTSPEQDLIASRVESEANDASLDNITEVVAEATQQPANTSTKVSAKDIGKDDNESRRELSLDVPDTALPSQDLAKIEKQDETVANKELAVTEEPIPAALGDIAGPSKTPEILSTEQQEQIPTDRPVQLDDSLSKEQEPEPEPEPAPISRKKSKKNKKKKKADTQAESEPASGTPPSTPIGISEYVTKADTTETRTGEPERTIANEGEWPESQLKSKDKNRRTASGTSTPLESMEDAPVDAPPETVTEENTPGNLTLEEISAVEGQSSKAKEVQEEKYSEPKDKDQNAEDINISHPAKEDVIVSDNQLASPAEEDQLVQPDEGPANETAQDISDHVELSVPVSPRTPVPTAPPMINVDLSPAQQSSHVEHERPFDQSLQPGKKARTELSSDDTMIPVPLSAQANIPPRNIEGATNDVPELLQPTEDATKVENSNAVSEDITPAREIAASYLESQPISMDDVHDNARENNDAEQISTSGLFPVITPRREIAASYFEGHPTTVQTDDYNMLEDNTQEPSSTRPSTSHGGVSISPQDAQSSQLEPEHVEEEIVSTQPDDEPRRPSPIQETAPSAREVAATLMESHLKSGKKETLREPEPMITEDSSPTIPTEGAALSSEKSGISGKGMGKKKQKSVDRGSPDTDNTLDDTALWESSQPKALEGGGRLDADAGDFRSGPGMEADDRSRAPSSPDAMEVDASTDLPELPAEQQDVAANPEDVEKVDIESPVVGREVQHELPKPRNAGHESPESNEPPTSEIIERLDDLDTSEHLTEPTGSTEEVKTDAGLLKSISPTRSYLSSGRASPRLLPPVEEETNEDLEKERQDRVSAIAAEANRDSGVVTNSPHPMRRSFVDASQRDSGVHLHDWPETASKKQEGLLQEEHGAIRTPQPNEKRTKKLGLGGETPKLSTPTIHDEVQDVIDPKKTRPSTRPPTRSSTPSSTAQEGQRSVSDTISRRSTPLAERQLRRTASNTSISRLRTPDPLRRPESPSQSGFRSGTNTPPLSLRRVDKRMSGDLRSLSSNLANNISRENLHQSQPSTTPVANEGRVRAKDMTDVYDGYGEGRIGSPRSPTRPQSMRRRQSMQVLELESRVDQLIAENRALAEAKHHAEQNLNHQAVSAITERDAEIESLKASLEWLQKEVTRLTEVNEGLHSAQNVLALQHNERYGRLESQHASASKELDEHRFARGRYMKTLEEKDAEIKELRAQLEATKEQVREMQRQILAAKPPDADFLRLKDEDYFDHRCQQLCSHVQQWVLRFSKFSDMRACRLTNEINDEKIIDRLDNSVLDGSDVDDYLRDRVRRRDIFMSMTMNMIWEFVFTRYLFGMDREQRQKLKSLEKLLLDVGPPHAVRQWRAVTLTLLSKRPAFGDQRNQDTEAVVQAVFQTLSLILPPPSNLEPQIQSQLRRVVREAVDLSVEMRTQRAEYMMLPPLQPEYDANGDLARTVAFNAQLMNERSGDAASNADYEAQKAVVRTVLFPLVVKKGDDNGVGDDEIVICPAQVLVAKARHHAHARMATPASEAGGVPLSRGATPSVSLPAQSTVSLQMQDAPPPQPTPPHEGDYI